MAQKSIPEEIFRREQLFKTMIFNCNIVSLKGSVLVTDVPKKANAIADRIIANKARYLTVAHKFANPIKWYHIALIHQMEGEGNFNTYLGNGQSLSKVTTIVPIGRGPFKSFEEGAIDAIKLQGLDNKQDWGIGSTLYLLEGYNGYGYTDFKGINSPYLWSGSNHYVSGYYVKDGKYDKNAVSQQIGIALILKSLIAKGVTDYV